MSGTTTRGDTRTRTSGRPTLRGVFLRHGVGPWNGTAVWVTVLVLILLLVGLLMSFSASIVDAAQEGDAFGTFRRQLLWSALGLPLFGIVASVDHRHWRTWSWPLLGLSVIGLLLVFVPGLGVLRFGSRRWVEVGPLVVQPSEVVKLAMLLWLADVLERKRPADGSLQRTEHLLVPALPTFFVVAILILLQPDLGTTIIVGLVVAAVLWVEGLTARIFALTAAAGVAAAGIIAVLEPYRFARLRGWLFPERYPLDAGFQLLQSRFALGSGGLFGVGLGEGRGKWNYIPNPDTDFVFAVIGEELGLAGAVGVIGLFLLLLYFGLHVAYETAEGFGRTVAFAITTWITGQALINVGTVTGLLPVTGVTLPLVSAGGSSLVVTLVSAGILVSIARGSRVAPGARRGGSR
jgi:cell division protein FtsW